MHVYIHGSTHRHVQAAEPFLILILQSTLHLVRSRLAIGNQMREWTRSVMDSIQQQVQLNTRMGRRSFTHWLISYLRTGTCTCCFSRSASRDAEKPSLLDIGPNAEGEIIAPMAHNLLDAGKWINFAGDCVFDTVRIRFVDVLQS